MFPGKGKRTNHWSHPSYRDYKGNKMVIGLFFCELCSVFVRPGDSIAFMVSYLCAKCHYVHTSRLTKKRRASTFNLLFSSDPYPLSRCSSRRLNRSIYIACMETKMTGWLYAIASEVIDITNLPWKAFTYPTLPWLSQTQAVPSTNRAPISFRLFAYYTASHVSGS